MKISNTTFIILVVSVVVGIIIMVLSFIIMRIKINKVKHKVLSDRNISDIDNMALNRKDSGELLWELKNKSKNPLEDSQLEFIINTMVRNGYKTFNVINSDSDYEEKSLIKITKSKKENVKPDLTILFSKENLNDIFDKEYKSLKEKQMLAVVNATKKNKEVKKLINYLKMIKARYDYTLIGKGIVLIVK